MGFYVMHRFDLDSVAYAKRMREQGLYVSISSGVKGPDYAIIDRLASEMPIGNNGNLYLEHSSAKCITRNSDR